MGLWMSRDSNSFAFYLECPFLTSWPAEHLKTSLQSHIRIDRLSSVPGKNEWLLSLHSPGTLCTLGINLITLVLIYHSLRSGTYLNGPAVVPGTQRALLKYLCNEQRLSDFYSTSGLHSELQVPVT